MKNKNFTQAEEALKQAVAQSTDDILSSVTALRLAAVQFQLGQFDPALDSLKLVKDEAWNGAKNMLIGDIQLAKGDKEAAKSAYQQAQQNATPLELQLIQVRLNNFIVFKAWENQAFLLTMRKSWRIINAKSLFRPH